MKNKIMEKIRKLNPKYTKEVLVKHSQGSYARQVLFWTAFSESSFFLVPPDVILISILLVKAERWKYYALLTTIGSVLGGIFGYFIGFFLFDTVGNWIINTYNLTESFIKVSNMYNTYAFWTIFIAAFSPIPYKLFTIAAGLFEINIFTFILASVIGRGLRFTIIAYLVNRYGEKFVFTGQKYFNIFVILLVLLLLLLFFLFF